MKIILLCLMVSLFAACGAPTPSFNITATKPEDTIKYQWANDTATFDITSPSGIGGARIARVRGPVPKQIALHLRLKGLESLKIRFDDHVVNVAMPSDGAPNPIQSAQVSSGEELELTPDSECWMTTEIVSVSETIPLADGYFSVELPPAFYASDTQEFSIEWIDFFR